MKQFTLIAIILLFTGCLYFNDRGVSAHLYDNCHSYYDENGNFIEKCDGNIIDYDEAQEGVIAIKDEIVEKVNEVTNTKESGTNIEELSAQEQSELQNITIDSTIKEEVESSQCPCK